MKRVLESFPVAFLCVCLSLVLTALALVSIAFGGTELSWWGWAWSLIALGLAVQIFPSNIREPIGKWAETPTLAVLLLIALRVGFFGTSERASLVLIDRAGQITGGARWVDRLFEERDASIVGSRLLVALDWIPAPEFRTLPDLLVDAYAANQALAPRLATPVVSTLLDLDSPDATNAILVEGEEGAELGVIFLHGYAGNFTFQCLEIAASLRALRASVICPSNQLEGRWMGADAQAIIASSEAILRARGARVIVLIGLSNGAIGASMTAERMYFDGLILISGVSSHARSPRVPALLIQGSEDTMVATSRVRRWARSHARVHYAELPGSHFVLIEARDEVRREMHAYLRALMVRQR